MKRFSVVLLLLLLSLSLFSTPFELPVSTVIIDPGHGGSDPGAVEAPLQEKDITLELSVMVKEVLESHNVEVILTRSDDTYLSLADRAFIASSYNPNKDTSSIFVSIHVNSSHQQEANGIELLVKHASKKVNFLSPTMPLWKLVRYSPYRSSELLSSLQQQSVLLATQLEQELVTQFPSQKFRGIKEQDVWVLNASEVPSVLVEVGFLSNKLERELLSDPFYKKRMAYTIAQGILGYITDHSSSGDPQ
ncbi:MAG: N-acetylmuramoyl-L-alanine amidase family protein [Sphaerochaetaceae bacterium]